MALVFEKEGILTTLQDLGRAGYRRFGINPNGAMDRTAARLVNLLLGNEESEAVIEMHYPAPEITFTAETVFAAGGADLTAELDGRPLENWRPVRARENARLRFRGVRAGQRAYLAAAGGFAAGKWLGSASANLKAGLDGLLGRRLRRGDRLETKAAPPHGRFDYRVSPSLIPVYSRFPTARVVAGPEYELLTGRSRQRLTSDDFRVAPQSDRMGFRLAGPPLDLLSPREMVSSAVNFGVVQLLPDGQMIVLMADHQTSGGYPRPACVIPVDLPQLAQLGAGDRVAFHLVSQEEAEESVRQFERDLKILGAGVRLKKM